jgi:hypothetical protein
MEQELLTGIVTLANGTTFLNDIAGRFFCDYAPEGVDYPHVVFFIVTGHPAYTFTDTQEDITLQFSIFSTSESAIEVATIAKDLKAVYDDCALSVTGYTRIWMIRKGTVTNVENMDAPTGTPLVRHWAIDYDIKLQKQ